MDKTLTIIIPSYNMEKYLDRCLSSLIIDAEHMKWFEALIINDGSTDRTSEIGHGYEAMYPDTFRVIDKENGHYGSCVNRGLAEAKGTFIKILDADDFLDKGSFNHFLDFLASSEVKSNADLILSDFIFFDESSYSKTLRKYKSPSPATIGQICTYDRYEWFIHGLTYRTNNLKSIDYRQIEGIPYTDHQWSFEPMITVKTAYRFNQCLYYYAIGRQDQSVSEVFHFRNIDKEISILKYLISLYNRIIPSISEDLNDFMKERLTLSIEHIYQLMILTYNRECPNNNLLNDFDDFIRKTNEDLYLISSNYTTRLFSIRFKIIKHWRDRNYPLLFLEKTLHNLANSLNRYKRN